MQEALQREHWTGPDGRSVSKPWRRRLFARLVFGLDAFLRRRGGIREYSAAPDCIFRIAEARAKDDIVLTDGTKVPCGAPILELHLFNEHLAVLDDRISQFRWARRLVRQFEFSFRELERHLRRDARCADLPLIHAELSLATGEGMEQLLRIWRRFGFEPGKTSRRWTPMGALHRLGHNILIALLVAATNPRCLRMDVLRRGRAAVYISRDDFARRYG